jgi:hypothetical protein
MTLMITAVQTQPVVTACAIPAREAQLLICNGRASADMQVKGHLNLTALAVTGGPIRLPKGLRVDSIDLSNCLNLEELPEGLQARRLNLSGCLNLRHLPAGLRCYELNLSGTGIRELPADLTVEFRLDLSECAELETLPQGLKAGALLLRNCMALEALPEDLDVAFLDLSGCVGLRRWPRRAKVQVGRLNIRGCFQLTDLPDWLTDVSQLDMAGCDNLTELPSRLKVRSWIDIANTGIQSLPAGMEQTQLRWRGITIDRRIAFAPETITAREVLETRNVELRRVLMERMGYENFLQSARSQTLDIDHDPGGERRLLHVPFGDDEPLVCLAVICPSTGRQYMLRVPPAMRSCRQAAAWLAGFDTPDAYQPIQET